MGRLLDALRVCPGVQLGHLALGLHLRATVPTVVGLAFTVSAICRSDFSGVALMSLAISSRFCSVVRWRRRMLAEMT
jgi:hypothetical protein